MSRLVVWGKVLVVMATLLVSDVAMAALIELGIQKEGSWLVAFAENGDFGGNHFDFDSLEAQLLVGGPFEGSGMESFTDVGGNTVVGWTAILSNSLFSAASGPPVSYLEFFFRFGDQEGNLSLNYWVWNGETNIGYGILSYDYDAATMTGSWSFEEVGAVPLPAAALLLGAGLVRLAAYGRRRRGRAF